MTTSTDAILFYGYVWEDEGSIWSIARPTNEDDESNSDDEDATDWVERLVIKRGHPDPWALLANGKIKGVMKIGGGQRYEAPEQPLLDAWYAAKREIEASMDINLDDHCSDECRCPFLAIKSSKITTNLGYPKEITSLEVKPNWDAKLQAWLDEFGLVPPEDQKPQWWLVSYCG